MIPVQGVEGLRVAVLGFGRSGRATAAALKAGGAEVVAWDDGADTRAAAEAEGWTLADLTRDAAWTGDRPIALMVTSPGIPHLYPAPHPALAQSYARGVPVEGICLYPIADHPGWDDDRMCPNGLLGPDPSGSGRSVDPALAAALRRSGLLLRR